MSEPDPEYVNLASRNGILPGFDWEADVWSDEGYSDLLGTLIFPFDDDPTLRQVVSQAQAQFRTLFPDTDERERTMFMAGIATLYYWFVSWTLHVRGESQAFDEKWLVDLRDVEAFIATNVVRLVSTVFAIDDDPDLDDAFADIVESITHPTPKENDSNE